MFIPATIVAEVLGISRQAAHKRCMREAWAHRYIAGEGGGRRLEIALASLPAGIQVRALQRAVTTDHRPRTTDHGPRTLHKEHAEGESGNRGTGDAWESARECDRAVAISRIAILDALETFLAGTGAGWGVRTRGVLDFVRAWNAAHSEEQVSKSTLARWRRAYQTMGRVGLLPAYATGARGHNVAKEIGDLVGRYWLDRQQRTLTVCHEIARVETARLYPHLLAEFPSLATVRRYVRRRWPQQAIILAREGESALRRRSLPDVETDFESYNVMDLWVSDHAQMDLDCISHEGKWIRPWVTDWRDFRSRKRVGWLVHEGPSADTALASFAVAVRRNGIPRGVKFDNGRDYSGRTFAGGSRRWRVQLDEPRVRALLEHLGCEVHFSLPGNPMGKASHESHYGIDREWFDKQWVSYCGKDPASRPEHLRYLRKRPDKLPLLAEVQYLYGLYAEWRNQQPHTGRGMEGRSPAEVFGAADYSQRVVKPRELALLLQKPSRPLTVGRNGIWIFDRWYWSETIAGHLGERVYVRYDLDAIGEIYAYTLDDRFIDVLRRTDLLAKGATAADVRKAYARKAFVRRIAKQAYEVRQEVAAQPDLVALYADQRGRRGAALLEKPKPKHVVEIVRTPFRAAAKHIDAWEAERGRRKAARAAASDPAELFTPSPARRAQTEEERAREALEELGRSFGIA